MDLSVQGTHTHTSKKHTIENLIVYEGRVDSHSNTWPPARKRTRTISHGRPSLCNHFNTSKWPPLAADIQVVLLYGRPLSCNPSMQIRIYCSFVQNCGLSIVVQSLRQNPENDRYREVEKTLAEAALLVAIKSRIKCLYYTCITQSKLLRTSLSSSHHSSKQ